MEMFGTSLMYLLASHCKISRSFHLYIMEYIITLSTCHSLCLTAIGIISSMIKVVFYDQSSLLAECFAHTALLAPY